MIYSMVMIKLNIHEAKTHLSEYLAKVEAGETILMKLFVGLLRRFTFCDKVK